MTRSDRAQIGLRRGVAPRRLFVSAAIALLLGLLAGLAGCWRYTVVSLPDPVGESRERFPVTHFLVTADKRPPSGVFRGHVAFRAHYAFLEAAIRGMRDHAHRRGANLVADFRCGNAAHSKFDASPYRIDHNQPIMPGEPVHCTGVLYYVPSRSMIRRP